MSYTSTKMLKQDSKNDTMTYNETIIAIQDIIFEYIHSNSWEEYEGFTGELSEHIIEYNLKSKEELNSCVGNFNHSFYSFNRVSKTTFLSRFPFERVLRKLKKISSIEIKRISDGEESKSIGPLTFSDIFPEILKINLTEAKEIVRLLNIEERIIQDTLRDALRKKGAGNIVERKSDTSLEVADLEDFSLTVGGKSRSFTVVVKGYRSVKHKKISLEDISHQVVKAYHGTEPDHVIVVLAKDPVDTLVTHLKKYGQTIGKDHLVILVDPVDLARFLRSTGVI